MHLSTILPIILLSALASATATAIPKPQPVFPVPKPFIGLKASSNNFAEYAYDMCKELGIDPHGLHPDDFTSDDGHGHHFEAGSKYALWAAAQNSVKMAVDKEKRDDSSISVVMWTDWTCSAGGYAVYDLDQHVGQKFFEPLLHRNKYSLSFTHGTVDPNYWRLHLKMWRGLGSDDCDETYHYVYGGPGCVTWQHKFTCVQLMYQ